MQELADRGLSVVGLDAHRIAAGAAGRNGGFLSCGGAMGMAGADSVVPFALREQPYRDTRAELERLAAHLGRDVVRQVGSLSLAGLPGNADDDELRQVPAHVERLRAERDALASIGVAVHDYDDVLGQGYFNPDTASVNPVHRAFGIAAALPSSVRLYEHSPSPACAPEG